MLSGSRISWINEASTKVSSLTMCVKTCRSSAMNSCFADSSIRKRTTSVILSDIIPSWKPQLLRFVVNRDPHNCSFHIAFRFIKEGERGKTNRADDTAVFQIQIGHFDGAVGG